MALDDKKRMTLLKHKRELLKKARKLAHGGSCSGFNHVVRLLDRDDEATLRIWATARDKEEIDALCSKAREKWR